MKNVIQCFLNLPKTSYGKKNMTKLKHAEGSVTVDSKLILGEMRHFYQQLYSSQGHTPAVLSNCLNFGSLPKLDSVSKASVRIRLLEEEYLFALKSFQRNKTPGTDGFWRSSIFVSGMRSPTCNLLIDCFNHGALFGRALHLPRQGSNHFFDSTNKYPLLLEKWRPTSLFRNTDYKLTTKCIAKRIEKVLPHLIGIEETKQATSIKGRFKSENVRLFSDIIKQNGKEEGMILFLDSEKSLHSLEWEYLFEVLDAMNLGPNIFPQLDPHILS